MTLVALAYLNAALSKLQPSWKLVANKAEMWLATQQLENKMVTKTTAKQFVKAKLNLVMLIVVFKNVTWKLNQQLSFVYLW